MTGFDDLDDLERELGPSLRLVLRRAAATMTDDEPHPFERADTGRVDNGAAGYLDAIRTRRGTTNLVEVTETSEPKPSVAGPTSRHRWRIITTAAAASVLILVGAVVLTAGDDPADQAQMAAEPENPVVSTPAEVVATQFVLAFGAFDVERASSYLADDADISALIDSWGAAGAEGTNEDQLRLFLRLLQAQGCRQILDSCEQQDNSASGINVQCRFAYHLFRSEELGREPFGGATFDLVVVDDQITRGDMGLTTAAHFSPEMREPFTAWLQSTYPQDAVIMFTDLDTGTVGLTDESFRLWDQHTREYAAAQGAESVDIAERFMAARSAYDSEMAMSFLADDLTVHYLDDNREDMNMPSRLFTRAEVASAFEIERIYQVRFAPFDCEIRPSVEQPVAPRLACTYQLDSRLRRIDGLPPVEEHLWLGIEDGRINRLSFPYLNASVYPGHIDPGELESFVRWLEQEHPEAVPAPLCCDRESGLLFRTDGQELVHNLMPHPINLLEAWLDEYDPSP